jgi:hypothetical protein
MPNPLDQNGFKSRKLLLVYLVLFLLSLGYLAAGKWDSLAVVYPVFCMSVLSAAGLYHGSNLGVKWLTTRNPLSSSAPQDDSEDEASPADPKAKK